MKLLTTCTAICCAIFLFAACKKKENNTNNYSAQRKMLQAGKWQLSASTATTTYMGADTTMDLYSQLADCEKDDFLTFADDGKATIDESANKCAHDPQIETGSWVLLSSDTKLAIIDNNPDTMDLEITSTQMTLRQVKPNTSGNLITYIDIYRNIR